MNIIEEITRGRKQRIGVVGHGMGVSLPPRRTAPIVPFGRMDSGDTQRQTKQET